MDLKRKLSEILNDLMNEFGTDFVADELTHVKCQRILYYELIRLFIAYDCYMAIFLQYLTLEDIARLDGAIKSYSLREIWLENLKRNCCQNFSIVYHIKNDECIKWCSLKSIQFKNLNFDKKTSTVSDLGLCILAKYCEKVKKISLTEMTHLTSEGLTYLASGCPNLEEMTANKTLCNESLKSFGNFCRKLKFVTIRGHRNLHEACAIKNDGIHALKNGCPALHTFKYFLELSSNIIVCDEYMKALAFGCKQLKSIDFDRAGITDKGLEALGQNCAMLESITLHDVGTTPDIRKYTDDGIKALAVGCKLLKVFNIAGTKYTRDHGIIALAQNCPLLEVLCLNSYNVSEAGFLELGKLKNLKFIEIWKCSNITDKSISSLLLHNRSIKQMRIGCTATFTDSLLSSISIHCPLLESLSFVDMGMDSAFTKPALIDLVFKCKRLNHIHLNSILPDLIKLELDKRKELQNEEEAAEFI